MFDIYEAVTDRIIAELEDGIIPWERGWTGVRSGAISHETGKPYSLINQMLLGRPGEFITYKQALEEGGHVKKGAKSRMIVFWKMMRKGKTDEAGAIIRDENGLPASKSIPILKYYNVFHIDDCEGIKEKYPEDQMPDKVEPIVQAEKVIDDYSARAKLAIEHKKQNQAYYSPTKHIVSLPLVEQFNDAEIYYETVFHELTHSTGHKSLLNRFTGAAAVASFGDESYSKEELVAEIGACGLMHEMGIESNKSFRNSAAYIQSWLAALKNDKRMIVSAASRAEKAIKLILNIQEEAEAQ